MLLCASCASQDRTAKSPEEPESTPLDPAADGTEQLSPGRHRLLANGDESAPGADVQLPAGFSSLGGFAVGVFDNGEGSPVHTVSYWAVSGVYSDPCSKKGGQLDAGRSVKDLVKALSAQRRTRSTRPTATTIDGHQGVELDLIGADDLAFENCVDGYFDIWDSSPGGGRYLQEPGQLLRLRILEVDGHRVVIETSSIPARDQGGLAAVDAIAESIAFAD